MYHCGTPQGISQNMDRQLLEEQRESYTERDGRTGIHIQIGTQTVT